jgi:hypothetical protein
MYNSRISSGYCSTIGSKISIKGKFNAVVEDTLQDMGGYDYEVKIKRFARKKKT